MRENGEVVQRLKRGPPTLREISKEDREGAAKRQEDDQDNKMAWKPREASAERSREQLTV